MERLPNQREITINKPNYADGKELYFTGGVKSTLDAMQTLSGNGFKLYIYFLKNINWYTEILMPSHIARAIGIARASYYRAFDELIEHHYLCLQDGKEATYTFYAKPHFSQDEE